MASEQIERRDFRADPRIEKTRRRVREATLTELAERGYSAFSVEAVSRRSGVAKSTIYRHWQDRAALVADAIEALNVQPRPDRPNGPGEHVGSAREGVRIILEHLVESMGTRSAMGRALPALLEAAVQDEAVGKMLSDYSARRRETLRRVIAAGVANGEFRASIDPEAATIALAGAFLYRRTLMPTPMDPAGIDALVATVLGGVDGDGA